MPSPAVPLSVENAVMLGTTGAAASMVTLSAPEAALVLPATSGAGAGRAGGPVGGAARRAVGAVGKRCRGEAPGPCSVGSGGSQQRDPVIDLDGGIGFGAAGE